MKKVQSKQSRMGGDRSKRSTKAGNSTSIFEKLEDRWMFSTGVDYQGGSVLPHIHTDAVFFGPDWTIDATYQQNAKQLNSFLGQLVSGPYMDQLAEYNTSSQSITRGSYYGADYTQTGWKTHQTTINKTIHTTIDDSDVRSMLNSEISAGRLPSPSGNRMYVVYVAPNVVVTGPSGNSLNDFCGYHDQANDNSGRAYDYAIIADPTGYPGKKPMGAPDGLSTVQSDSVVTSHEVAEAVTDPAGGGWWNSDSGDEIGDIAAEAGNATATLNGYLVQKEWSNEFKTSYSPPSNAISVTLTQFGSNKFAMALTSDGALEELSGSGGWTTLDSNVTSVVYSKLNGLNQLFDLHSNGQVFNTIDGHNMVFQGANDTSIGIGTLKGTNYLFGLNNAGTLSISHGTGWSTLDTNVSSFVYSTLNGLNQLFDLHSNGQVFNTIDGHTMVAQGSGFTSIGVQSLEDTNYLFGLRSNGVLSISHGTGWSTLDTNVTSFVVSDLTGLNQLFDLHSDGQVFNTFDGHSMLFQGADYNSIGVGNLQGVNYLFGLQSSGSLMISHGTGWSPLDTNVKSFVYSPLNGLNQLFDLHNSGAVKNTLDGATMMSQGSGYSKIGIGNLGGSDFLFGLTTSHVLDISHGTGWSTLDTGVTTFFNSNLSGLNQLFDIHTNGVVLNTIDGQNMVAQGSGFKQLGVGNLAGTNYLFGLSTSGTLYISHGTGWFTLDTGVKSFVFSPLSGLNQLFDLHSNGVVDNTIDGQNMVWQGAGFSEIAVGQLDGEDYLAALGSGGVLSISHGTGWSTLDTSVASFAFSQINGSDVLTDKHVNGLKFETFDGHTLISA